MYGLIGRMLATAGRREELLAILLDNNEPMPGCRSYIVARDPASEDGIWITEVWDSQAEHQGSLQLPHVQAMIAKARPIIAGFAERFETEPLGRMGL
jgi:quinol monooxygenase YgiN